MNQCSVEEKYEMPVIRTSKADYEYIISHIDNDIRVSTREAVSEVVRKAKEYDKLNPALTNDCIIKEVK